MCFSDKPTITKKGKKPRKLDFVGEEPPADLVLGWRAWRVKRDAGGTVTLKSPIQPSEWKPGEPLTGKVDPTRNSGIYAFKTLKALKRYTEITTSDTNVVIGQVGMWGEIAEHADGYRAENGYPVRLWTNDITIQSKIRDLYAASVQIGYARDLQVA